MTKFDQSWAEHKAVPHSPHNVGPSSKVSNDSSLPSDGAELWRAGQVAPDMNQNPPVEQYAHPYDTHELDVTVYGDSWDPTGSYRVRETTEKFDFDHDGK